ncbi:MAG: TetR/AcrR family transcriptional regulator [Myxococcales bacterium]|nr:TetR/AcrR family transcriptional regulator [Myxococcales bacterium]
MKSLADPSPAPDVGVERRKQILTAAVQVFAEKGFHKTRVSDVARRAGVAYGLIYHYFSSKDDLLNSIFEDNWGIFLKVLDDLEADPSLLAVDKLGRVSALLVDALQVVPTTIQVIIQEVSRSTRFVQPGKLDAFQRAFDAIQAILEDGQRQGQVDPSIDARVAAHMFLGAMETVCTGVMLGHIDCSTPEVSRHVKDTIERVLAAGVRKPS